MASFPSAVFSPTTRTPGQTIQPGHINDAQDEIIALETFLRVGWTSVGFSAGNFTGSGSMTWTLTAPDQAVFVYRLIDPFTMVVAVQIDTSTVGGTPDLSLQIVIPGGKTAAYAVSNAASRAIDANVVTSAIMAANGTTISFIRSDAANWGAATNTTYVSGQLVIPITG